MAEGVKRKISAILSADVVGYSKLMEADEETTVRTIESYRTTISFLVEQHDGRVVDNPGDNILSEFASVVDAVQCAVEIQHVIKAKNVVVPESRRMQFRIGISLEDVIEEGNRIYGDGVNIAARIEGMADPGGICISSSAYEQIKRKLALGYEDLGEHSVKNISWPVQVYRVPMELGDTTEPSTRKEETGHTSEKPSIAVLPFDNMSSDPEQEYFSDGITEEIITRLSMNAMLLVIARNSTFFYKGKGFRVKQIGEELGATYAVEGSVRRSGDRIRVTAQLIESATESHIWADKYDRELKDIFAIQDSIAMQVTASLNVMLTGEEIRKAKRRSTSSPAANDLFWRGVEQYHIGNHSGAKKYFQEAADLDPKSADSLAYLGWCQYWLWAYGSDSDDPSERPKLSNRIFDLAQKAISLDHNSFMGYALLSRAYMRRGDYDIAINKAQRSVDINPNNTASYFHLGMALHSGGRPLEAIEVFDKATQLNPKYPDDNSMLFGMCYRSMGKYEQAIRDQQKAIAQGTGNSYPYAELAWSYLNQWESQQSHDPMVIDLALKAATGAASKGDSHWVLSSVSLIHLWKKQHNRAIATAERCATLYPNHIETMVTMAEVLARSGRATDAAHMLEETVDVTLGSFHYYNPELQSVLGMAYRLMGQYEKALDTQQAAYRSHWQFITAFHTHTELLLLYAESDRMDEAQTEAAEILKLVPDFSVDVYGERVPYKDPAQAERDMAALRKVGLK